MLSTRQLEALLQVYQDRMQAVTDAYLKAMGEHLRDIGSLAPTDVHRLTELKRVGANARKIRREVAKAASISTKELERVFRDIAENNEDFAKTWFAEDSAPKVKGAPQRSAPIERILKAQLRITAGEMKNLSRTTIETTRYREAVDLAVQTVQAGVTDYRSAIREAMKRAAVDGLRVKYPSGTVRRLDTAMRQNVLDGVRAVNRDILTQLGKEYGADGVEISAHELCAEDHLPYQGRQFRQKDFDALQASLDRPFGQWNCKHTIFPIIYGVSQPAHSPEELAEINRGSARRIEIDGKKLTRYEWTQEQRKIETAVRRQKDVANLAKASGDGVARREAQSKINALMDRYDRITEGAGLETDYKRMYVAGFRSVSADPNLTFIRNDAKIKAASDLPKVLRGLPDEVTKATAEVELPIVHGVVPAGVSISSVTVIAGAGTKTPIRDLRRLYASYPDYGAASSWQKKSGVVNTDNFVYELHWYEANGQVPPNEIKTKGVR